MHISEIRLTQYKSVTEARTIHPRKGLSIFIGKNNSGKTTVLDALIRFFRPEHNIERLGDKNSHIELGLQFTQKDRKEVSAINKKIGEKCTLVLHGNSISLQTEQESAPVPHEFLRFIQHHTIRIAAMRDLDYVKMQKLFEEFKSGWPKVYKEFSAKLQVLFPEIKAPAKLFEQQRSGIMTTVKEFGENRSIERLGLGFRHLFIILLYFYHPRYDIILIDEPEIHLHPQMIKRLSELLESNMMNKQIFITTHSTLFVRPDNLSFVYRTVRSKNQSTHFHSLGSKQINEQRLEQELNADNIEMFFADHVLLVEGISDRVFIRELLQKFYETSKDVKVIPVHGKENVDTYVEILNDFHIPYTILFDKDAFNNTTIRVLQHAGVDVTSFEQAQVFYKQKGIFFLPHGNLEHHYPQALYERELSKPLLALKVARAMSKEQFSQGRMLVIKEMLDTITSS